MSAAVEVQATITGCSRDTKDRAPQTSSRVTSVIDEQEALEGEVMETPKHVLDGAPDALATTERERSQPTLPSGKRKRKRTLKTAAEQEVARHRREREGAGSIVGAIAGSTVGTLAGPAGAVAGAFFGAAVGAAVGGLLTQNASDREALADELERRKP